jgi:hypothetical protein
MAKQPKQYGNSRDYLVHQLRKSGRRDLLRHVNAGLMSPHAAAIEAGLRQKPSRGIATLPDYRARLLAKRKRELGIDPQTTCDELAELWLGPSNHGSVFRSEEERRQKWEKNRAFLLASDRGSGRRCWGWWVCDSPIPFPGYDRQKSALFEAGLLTEPEREHVLREWRHAFERSYEPHFWYCAGVGKNFTGPRARHLHWSWADIPDSLLLAWARDRLHASRRIRKLAAEAQRSGKNEKRPSA